MASEKEVPFNPGRGDASKEQTDENSFGFLSPSQMALETIIKIVLK